MSPEEELSKELAEATQCYARKDYTTAAEHYSLATQLQAELNGEMAPQNADLLYLYGRCLYHVAVSKSDVLGSKVASDKPVSAGTTKRGTKRKADGTENVEADAGSSEVQTDATEKKPFFQIQGDDADWSSEDDEDTDTKGVESGLDGNKGEGEGAEEDDDDDFVIAYEILDIARVLLERQLEERKTQTEDASLSKSTRDLQERLADTYDLQAEIGLENEQFKNAVSDSRASLNLKLKLFPQESSMIAEAHYKLSLALEFASVVERPEQEEDDSGKGSGEAQVVDQVVRKEAAEQMDLAIKSSRLRVAKEREDIKQSSGSAKEERLIGIKDVEDIIEDMVVRYQDLVSSQSSDARGILSNADGITPDVGGILGTIMGQAPAVQRAKIEEATRSANDLSGVIRHKKKKQDDEPRTVPQDRTSIQGNGNGKRKVLERDEDDEDELATDSGGKKPKT